MVNLSWKVFRENTNTKQIEEYDIFENTYWNEVVKTLIKETNNKEEFEESFRIKLMSMYWCRSEYETVITSWPTYVDKDEVTRLDAEQTRYYNEHSKFPYCQNVKLTVAKKIDIYYQLQLNWRQFIDYVYTEACDMFEGCVGNG